MPSKQPICCFPTFSYILLKKIPLQDSFPQTWYGLIIDFSIVRAYSYPTLSIVFDNVLSVQTKC